MQDAIARACLVYKIPYRRASREQRYLAYKRLPHAVSVGPAAHNVRCAIVSSEELYIQDTLSSRARLA